MHRREEVTVDIKRQKDKNQTALLTVEDLVFVADLLH